MVKNSSVSKQQVQQPRAFVQLQRTISLITQKGANVDAEILLIRQRRAQTQDQPVIIRLLVSIQTQSDSQTSAETKGRKETCLRRLP